MEVEREQNNETIPTEHIQTAEPPDDPNQDIQNLDLNKPPHETALITHPTYHTTTIINQPHLPPYHQLHNPYIQEPETWRTLTTIKKPRGKVVLTLEDAPNPTQVYDTTYPCITYLPHNQGNEEEEIGPTMNTNYLVETPPESPQPSNM